MTPVTIGRFGCAIAILVTAACANNGSAPPAGGSPVPATAAASAGGSASSGNACDRKWITQADVEGILSDPISSVTPLAGDAQSCVFNTATFVTLTVSTRPGLGKTTVDTWASGKMPVSATPISGVGDQAVWQDTLREIIAQKNNLLCDIGISGPPGASKLATPELQKRMGGLCNKIFAAQ
jgi:hypothetical protein